MGKRAREESSQDVTPNLGGKGRVPNRVIIPPHVNIYVISYLFLLEKNLWPRPPSLKVSELHEASSLASLSSQTIVKAIRSSTSEYFTSC